MNHKDIILYLGQISAKYGYGKGLEPFTNEEWNAIFLAKDIINDYYRMKVDDHSLRQETAKDIIKIVDGYLGTDPICRRIAEKYCVKYEPRKKR